MSNRSLSTRLRTCTDLLCRNSENISVTKAFLPDHYPLLNVECGECGSVWLVGVEHDKKWPRRRYKFANDHLKSVSHSTHFPSNEVQFCIPIHNEDENSESIASESSQRSILSNIYPSQESNVFTNENIIFTNFF